MATRVTVRVPSASTRTVDPGALEAAVVSALDVFGEVDRSCTRFDPSSALMRANGSPTRWHVVPPALFSALLEAKRAYDTTSGRFDPRVLRTLVGLGYARTLDFDGGAASVEHVTTGPTTARSGPWRPRFKAATSEVVLGREPVDLGGIGKGLAVRWASEALSRTTRSFLVEAGGDCYCSGTGPEDDGWLIGIEDPTTPSEKIAVLSLADRAVTTSSIRLRQWRAAGRTVHHLIDPATGRPGGRGLLAVTVVGDDPARAEVWSKALFIAGHTSIAEEASRHGIAALWVAEDGTDSWSAAMAQHLRWHR